MSNQWTWTNCSSQLRTASYWTFLRCSNSVNYRPNSQTESEPLSKDCLFSRKLIFLDCQERRCLQVPPPNLPILLAASEKLSWPFTALRLLSITRSPKGLPACASSYRWQHGLLRLFPISPACTNPGMFLPPFGIQPTSTSLVSHTSSLFIRRTLPFTTRILTVSQNSPSSASHVLQLRCI